ncbi:hypothetical protein KIN20_032136 [Parelaphostrongylus tenuis]|uniref:Uncharacterized protein n=1 Tax=Parelaphostrongylus tenuis TaxID=148309 RepID=A0AAD5R6I9_PARTN|nr:hypothetical protein KIN20_032136 [Parelaphostrongylus tenuis]
MVGQKSGPEIAAIKLTRATDGPQAPKPIRNDRDASWCGHRAPCCGRRTSTVPVTATLLLSSLTSKATESACGAVVRGALRRTRGQWFNLALMAHQAIRPSGVGKLVPGSQRIVRMIERQMFDGSQLKGAHITRNMGIQTCVVKLRALRRKAIMDFEEVESKHTGSFHSWPSLIDCTFHISQFLMATPAMESANSVFDTYNGESQLSDAEIALLKDELRKTEEEIQTLKQVLVARQKACI